MIWMSTSFVCLVLSVWKNSLYHSDFVLRGA